MPYHLNGVLFEKCQLGIDEMSIIASEVVNEDRDLEKLAVLEVAGGVCCPRINPRKMVVISSLLL